LNRKVHEACLGKPDKHGIRSPIIVPPITFHGLRHSAASLLLENDAPLLEVSRILGHHSPDFTAKTYAHVSNRRLRQVVDLFPRRGSGAAKVAQKVAQNRIRGGSRPS
jgi:integrase